MPRIDRANAAPQTPAARPAAPPPAAAPERQPGLGADAFVRTAATAPIVTGAQAKSLWDSLCEKAGGLWNTIKTGVTDGANWLKNSFNKLVFGFEAAPWQSRTVTHDPSDVNHTGADEARDAQAAIRRHSAQEAQALAKLSADAQKQVEALQRLTADDPMARRALQVMLLDGRVPGAKALGGGGNLLEQLSRLATQPLAAGLDRASFVADVIQEAEDPIRIAQHEKGTCGATTSQILLVRRNPAEYVRLLTGLASPGGEATMAGGKTIRRAEDWQADNDGDRSASSRIYQAAVMDFAELPGLSYDNSEDRAKLWFVPLWSGLSGGGLARALTQLLGTPYQDTRLWAWNRQDVWEATKKALAAGAGPLPVTLSWDSGGHFVQIDKVEGGLVHYTNPWGQQETIAEDEFLRHLKTVQAPKGALG